MHELFSEWYRKIDLELNRDRLNKRWAAIENIIEEFETEEWLNCARFFAGRTLGNESFLTEFVQAFKTTDPTFPSRDNNQELRVLAGSVLAEAMTQYPSVASTIAFAVLCVIHADTNVKNQNTDLLSIAEKHLVEASTTRQHVPEEEEEDAEDTEEEAVADDEDSEENAENEENGDDGDDGDEPDEESSDLAIDPERRISILEEEVNVLWWLFGEYSRNHDVAFTDLPETCEIALIGKELSELISVLPGPHSAQAFLHKALRLAGTQNDSQKTISEVVNSVPRPWREDWIKETDLAQVAELAPCLEAIQLSIKVDDDDSWKPMLKHQYGDLLNQRLPPLEWSLRIYRECLLHRCIDEADGNG